STVLRSPSDPFSIPLARAVPSLARGTDVVPVLYGYARRGVRTTRNTARHDGSIGRAGASSGPPGQLGCRLIAAVRAPEHRIARAQLAGPFRLPGDLVFVISTQR